MSRSMSERERLLNEFTMTGDVYQVQRRPSFGQIVINDDYQGVRVLDPWTGADIIRTEFTVEYRESGIISEWCLRADGNRVLVLNEKPRSACLLSLDSSTSRDVPCPPLRLVTDVRYVWEGDSLWISGGKSFGFYELQWHDGTPAFVPSGGLKARFAHPSWRRALEGLPVDKSHVKRVEPDRSRLLYHLFDESPGRVGMIDWRSGATWSAQAGEEVPILAFHDDRMFVLQEFEVQQVTRNGDVEAVYRAPDAFRHSGMDTIPSIGGRPAALVVMCTAQFNPRLARCLVYRLDG